jgi:hypothetical protein
MYEIFQMQLLVSSKSSNELFFAKVLGLNWNLHGRIDF